MEAQEQEKTVLEYFSEKWVNFARYVDGALDGNSDKLAEILGMEPLQAVSWLKVGVLPWYEDIMKGDYPVHLRGLLEDSTKDVSLTEEQKKAEVTARVKRYLTCFKKLLSSE